jgi:DNA-binding FadR family transcriptional regulator
MAEPGLQRIERSPLYEVVATRLQEFIEAEHLKPGDRLLPERELAERLGVGRASVRQALTAMRVMGLIDIRPGAGIYLQRQPADLVSPLVAELAGAQVDHPMIWEVREGVEVQAARLAARRRGEEDLEAMRQALAAMDRSIEGGGTASTETASRARPHLASLAYPAGPGAPLAAGSSRDSRRNRGRRRGGGSREDASTHRRVGRERRLALGHT